MKEVISLPAGQTQDIIKKYLIHAHPHPRSYKEAQYITLRKAGGIMDTLYSVHNDFVIKPKDKNNVQEAVKYLDNDSKERLLGYIHERDYTFGFDEKEEYKFYLLKVEQFLHHLPKPKENLQSHTYYSIEELTSGKREVTRESEIGLIKKPMR